MKDIFVVAEHYKEEITEATYEMLGKGKELAAELQGKLTAVLLGSGIKNLAGALGSADSVIYVDDPYLKEFNPFAYTKVLTCVIKERNPYIILVSSSTQGMDLGSLLAAHLDAQAVTNCINFKAAGGKITSTSQMYGGKINIDVSLGEKQTIVLVQTGAFQAAAGKVNLSPAVEELKSPVSLADLPIQFNNFIEPPAGDIDITKVPILIGAGRGVGQQDNLQELEDLAQMLGGAVSGSRPVIDQKWLPKTRQVGKSGMIVKPKVYLACGISGAPEHVEGMKDSEVVIAINTDPNAPIFGVSDYGVVGDMFDIIPILKEELAKIKA